MHYIKCSSCGKLNQIKTEYQVFCSHCNRKLENNFTDWKKANPKKTFDNFKELICVSEEDMQNSSPEVKPKPKGLKYWIGFFVVFVIAMIIGQYGSDSLIKFLRSEKTTLEVLDQKWIKETYGDFGLTVETPAIMIKGDIPLTEEVKAVIDKMNVYEYNSNKGFKVLINSVKYNSVIGSANLQGAANGSVNEMKLQKGVTDFIYSEDEYPKNDIPGFIQQGNYKQKGIDVEFINTGFSKELIFWQVLVIYQSDDEVGRKAAKRVIESIEIQQ